MPSRNSVGVERKIEHRLFLLSVWSKGIVGLVETIGGLLWLFIPHTDWRTGVASKHLTFRARDTGFHSADPPLLLRRVDNENVALALTGVIKRDSFSVGRLFGRSVATARLGALPDTGPIRVHNINFIVGSCAIGREHNF